VDSGAEDALEEFAFEKNWIAIEVFAEARAGFFGVDEADGDALLDQVGEDFEEGDEGFFATHGGFCDVEILDVGGDDPEEALRFGDEFLDDAVVDLFVEEEFGHEMKMHHGGAEDTEII